MPIQDIAALGCAPGDGTVARFPAVWATAVPQVRAEPIFRLQLPTASCTVHRRPLCAARGNEVQHMLSQRSPRPARLCRECTGRSSMRVGFPRATLRSWVRDGLFSTVRLPNVGRSQPFRGRLHSINATAFLARQGVGLSSLPSPRRSPRGTTPLVIAESGCQ